MLEVAIAKKVCESWCKITRKLLAAALVDETGVWQITQMEKDKRLSLVEPKYQVKGE